MILEHDIDTLFEPMWLGYSLILPNINGTFYYITCRGEERIFCCLDQGLTNPKLISKKNDKIKGVFPDRLVYVSRNKSDLTEQVSYFLQ